MLGELPIVGFVPTRNADEARRFYEGVLGLTFVRDDGFALTFRAGPTTIRVVRAQGAFTPAPYTILGWEVDALAETVARLAERGVELLRVPGLPQDERGIWTTPDGSQVAWFKDRDGNTLSLSRHPK